MPVNKEDKAAIIDQLENARTKASRLIISLRFAGKVAEANKVKQKVRTLGGKIDDLLAKSMKTWSGNGKMIIQNMKKANQSLQSDITEIKKKKDMANKIIKALGRLDDVIDSAKDVLGKL